MLGVVPFGAEGQRILTEGGCRPRSTPFGARVCLPKSQCSTHQRLKPAQNGAHCCRSDPRSDGLDVGRPPPVCICTLLWPAIGRRNRICHDSNSVTRAWVVHLGGDRLPCYGSAKVCRI